jgi:hypothetical protein
VLLLPLLVGPFIASAAGSGVRRSLNEKLDGEVAWDRASLTVWGTFPRISLDLHGVTVRGPALAGGGELLRVGRVRLTLDVAGLLAAARSQGVIVVAHIDLRDPEFNLVRQADGTANWMIRPASDHVADGAGVSIDLQSLTVSNGALSFLDALEDRAVVVGGVDAALAVRVAAGGLDVRMDVQARSLSHREGGVVLARDLPVGIVASATGDRDRGRYAFDSLRVTIGALAVHVHGSVTAGESPALDIAFSAPAASLADLVSLAPQVFAPEWQQARASGTVEAAGWVRGAVGPGLTPAFELSLSAIDGSLQHPAMPLPLTSITLRASAGGDAGGANLIVEELAFRIGTGTLRGSLRIDDLLGVRASSLGLRASLSLNDLRQAWPMVGVEHLSGRIDADVVASARAAAIEGRRFSEINAEGMVTARSLEYRGEAVAHALAIDTLHLVVSPQRARLEAARGTAGSSDFEVAGSVENLLAYLIDGETLAGRVRVQARVLNLDEWRSDDEVVALPVPARVDIAADLSAARLILAAQEFDNARGSLRISNERLTLDRLSLGAFGGEVVLTGAYDTSVPAKPSFDVALVVKSVDIARAATMPSVAIAVPLARHARGRVSADFRMAGEVASDFSPILDRMSGRGVFESKGLALDEFPVLLKVADLVRMDALRSPAVSDFRSTFSVRDGRLHVSPVAVNVASIPMSISGSHGFDQSLDYRLEFALPAARFADAALATRLGTVFNDQLLRLGADLRQLSELSLAATITGTVSDPSVGMALGAGGDGAAERRPLMPRLIQPVGDRARAEVDEARVRVDAARAERIASAEAQAERIMAEARIAAAAARRQGNEQADALVAQATNPVARRAAEAAASRLRSEADRKAEALIQAAEEQAARLVEAARSGH